MNPATNTRQDAAPDAPGAIDDGATSERIQPTDTHQTHDAIETISWGPVAVRALIGLGVLAAGLAVLGALGSLFVFEGTVGDAEHDVVAWIAERRIGAIDSATTIVSALSDTWTVIGVIVGSSTMLWVTRHRRHAAMVVLAIALEFLTFLVVGALVDRPRPDVETLGSIPSTPSFPSGHSAAAFVISGSLVLVARSVSTRTVPRWLWTIPIVMSLLVAASRVYEGVHNPIDVVAGLLLGVGAVTAAAYATGVRVPQRPAPDEQRDEQPVGR